MKSIPERRNYIFEYFSDRDHPRVEIAACNEILFLDDSRFERSPLMKSPRSLRTGDRVYVPLYYSYRKSHLRYGGEFYGYDFLGNCNESHQSIILVLTTAKHETRINIIMLHLQCLTVASIFTFSIYRN